MPTIDLAEQALGKTKDVSLYVTAVKNNCRATGIPDIAVEARKEVQRSKQSLHPT
jgi:NADPH-dependent 7-cyano-7-deazaguanine reductase QueF